MINKSLLLFSLLMAFILSGCATPPGMIYLKPIPDSPNMQIFSQDNMEIINYKDISFIVTATLAEYKEFYIVALQITNETSSTITEDEYFIWLFDGKDHKPLKYLDKNNVANIRNIYLEAAESPMPEKEYEYKYSGSGYTYYGDSFASSYGSSSLYKQETSASVGRRLGSAIGIAIEKGRIRQALDQVVDNYFSFRPIYANDSRDGFLCFYTDFKLDYPLILRVKLKEDVVEFKFYPRE